MAHEDCTNLSDERRRRRSDNPLVAMRYQLMQVMEDVNLAACVLASEEGLLLVAPATLSEQDADLLAALPTLAQGSALATDNGLVLLDSPVVQSYLEALSPALRAAPGEASPRLYTQEFWAWDQPLTLVALGALSRSQELTLMRAIMGIRRIARQTTYRAA